MEFWGVIGINPIPWRVGPLSPGRRNGKVYCRIGPDAELQGYQEAVREMLEDQAVLIEGEVEVELFFWRNMEPYLTPQARTHRTHQADATNMQKGFEDAIQKVLIENDRNVRRISSTIVEQAHDIEPCVVVHVLPWQGFNPISLPERIWLEVDLKRSSEYHQETIL